MRERLKIVCTSLLVGTLFVIIWQAAVGGVPPGKGLPGPLAVARAAGGMLAHPFYDNGPNDKGIGRQFLASLGRLAIGYVAASETSL